MGRSITIILRHSLGATEARARICAAVESLKGQFGGSGLSAELKWTGDTAKARITAFGRAVDGSLLVESDCVQIVFLLPFALAAFAGSAQMFVEKYGEQILGLSPPH